MLNSTYLPRPPWICRTYYCKITQQNFFFFNCSSGSKLEHSDSKTLQIFNLLEIQATTQLQVLLFTMFQKGFVRKQIKEIESQIESACI